MEYKNNKVKDQTSEVKDQTSEVKDQTSEVKDQTSEVKDQTSEVINFVDANLIGCQRLYLRKEPSYNAAINRIIEKTDCIKVDSKMTKQNGYVKVTMSNGDVSGYCDHRYIKITPKK